jgi:hypothetical protein
MDFQIGKNRIEFNKGFKPKSLTLFLKTYSLLGSEEELTKIYDKLNGNTTRTSKKSRKVKRESDSGTDVQSDKTSRKKDS